MATTIFTYFDDFTATLLLQSKRRPLHCLILPQHASIWPLKSRKLWHKLLAGTIARIGFDQHAGDSGSTNLFTTIMKSNICNRSVQTDDAAKLIVLDKCNDLQLHMFIAWLVYTRPDLLSTASYKPTSYHHIDCKGLQYIASYLACSPNIGIFKEHQFKPTKDMVANHLARIFSGADFLRFRDITLGL
jgi:hypothetical protein